MQHIFISYKHEDLDFAENVIARLEKAGFSTWGDHKIGIGEEWRTMIDLAIKNSFALIVIMTPEAKKSEYVTYEWAFAWGAGIKVIPLMLSTTPLHPRLEALQYLDFTNPKSRPWDQLLEEVKSAQQAPLAHTLHIPLNSPPFIRQAVTALDSANAKERDEAIRTLAQTESQEAYEVLRDAVRHPIADVRRMAVIALRSRKNSSAIPIVLEALRDFSSEVRLQAILTLEQIGGSSVLPTFLDMLHDPSTKVRLTTIQAIGKVGNEIALPALRDSLSDSNTAIRKATIEAFAQLGAKGSVVISDLCNALADPDDEVRQIAIEAVIDLKAKDSKVLYSLYPMLSDPNIDIRYKAIEAFIQLEVRDDLIGPTLRKAFNSFDLSSYEERSKYLSALSSLKKVDIIALPILYDALTKNDSRVRTQAIVVLGKIAHPESVNVLAQALDSNYSDEVEAAINALEKIKTRSAIEALQKALTYSKRGGSKVRNIERALESMHQVE